jgi:hypothetical protein
MAGDGATILCTFVALTPWPRFAQRSKLTLCHVIAANARPLPSHFPLPINSKGFKMKLSDTIAALLMAVAFILALYL